jgi:hypothetical protein
MADNGFQARMSALAASMSQRRVTISAPVQNAAIFVISADAAEQAGRLISSVERRIDFSGVRFMCVAGGIGLFADAFARSFGNTLNAAEIDIIVLQAGVLDQHDLNLACRWLAKLPSNPAVICCAGQVDEPIVLEACQEAERRRKYGPAPVIMRS